MSQAATSTRDASPLFESLESRLLLSGDWYAWDLGTLGGPNSWAFATNEVGHVVGVSETGQVRPNGQGVVRAFYWSETDGMLDLGTLGGWNSWAYGVNNSSMVVGMSEIGQRDAWGQPITHAFVWTPSTGMISLGTLGGSSSAALDANDAGQVVGWAHNAGGRYRAFVWSAQTGMQGLGTLYQTGNSVARGINGNGEIVGDSDTGFADERGEITAAFYYSQQTGMIDLMTLGGQAASASAINLFGEVVGWSDAIEHYFTGQQVAHAYYLPASGPMQDISWHDGTSWANAINDYAEILAVQQSGTANRPYFWSAGQFTFLDTHYGMTDATGINNAGQIVGTASHSGIERAILLDPNRPHVTVTGSTVAEPLVGQTGTMAFTIRLSEALDREVELSYVAVDADALQGINYHLPTGTLVFAPGQTMRTVTVQTQGDGVFTGDQGFYLNVYSLAGDVLGGEGWGLIVDSDSPPAPDLQIDLGQTNLPGVLIPGDDGRVRVFLTNVGEGRASGYASVAIYASLDFHFDPTTDILIGQQVNRPVQLAPGEWRRVNVPVSIDASLPPGDYYLLAVVTPHLSQDDLNVENDVIGYTDPFEVAWKFGTFGGRTNARLHLTDPATGREVRFVLRGGGMGEVIGADFSQIALTGTTDRSLLRIGVPGPYQTSVGDIYTNGSLREIDAAKAILLGDLTVPGGVRGRVRLAGVLGGDQQIYLGPGGPMNLVLGAVQDLTLISLAPVRRLRVDRWHDLDSVRDRVEAPWMRRLVSGGLFQADLVLAEDRGVQPTLQQATIQGDLVDADWQLQGSLGSLVVEGAIVDSRVATTGDVDLLRMQSAVDSDFLAGVNSDFSGRHIGATSDLLDPQATIRRVQVRPGGGFVGSNISAGRIGQANIRGTQTAAAQTFGLWLGSGTDRPLRRVRMWDTQGHRWVWTLADDDPMDVGSFVVRVV